MEGTRRRVEKGKAWFTSQNHYTRDHTLHGTVLCSHLDTNSIVGTDISLYNVVGAAGLPYGKKPLTCLWASIVL